LDRQTRKDLKSDAFAEEVFDIFEWTTEHKSEVLRYGGIALAVAVIALAWTMYSRHEADVRQVELAKALRIDDASFGPNDQGGRLHFDTEEAKNKAREQAFADVAARFSGTQEGAVAETYLAGWAVDKGDLAGAEKRFKHVVDDAPKEFAALAKLALAQVYASENKPADAEKLLRELIASPTTTVSKEQSTIVLGQVLAASKPDEARKLLDPLRTSTRTVVSRAAINAAGSISGGAAGSTPAKP
jgi:predicted negative regulator of RcsB-dependent stress response